MIPTFTQLIQREVRDLQWLCQLAEPDRLNVKNNITMALIHLDRANQEEERLNQEKGKK